ncbi:hypothetical protein IID20_04890 [Patescibacteria group bacterium]|nr:hypothetical protein [Patescibacteria group bacterium]
MIKNNQAISLIITLLIISSILTGTILVGDILIRHSQVVKGTEISEIAYFAAEAAIEKSAYEILKNYENISDYNLTGSFNSGDYSVESGDVTADTTCPNPDSVECNSGSITGSNPWNISLASGQSFQLDLDINGAAYPSSLSISRNATSTSDLIIYDCTTAGTPRDCSSTAVQTFKVEFPYNLVISATTHYYKIRINNLGPLTETYTLTPTNNLPIGINVSAKGTYSEYERRIKSNYPKWQKFGI